MTPLSNGNRRAAFKRHRPTATLSKEDTNRAKALKERCIDIEREMPPEWKILSKDVNLSYV